MSLAGLDTLKMCSSHNESLSKLSNHDGIAYSSIPLNRILSVSHDPAQFLQMMPILGLCQYWFSLACREILIQNSGKQAR